MKILNLLISFLKAIFRNVKATEFKTFSSVKKDIRAFNQKVTDQFGSYKAFFHLVWEKLKNRASQTKHFILGKDAWGNIQNRSNIFWNDLKHFTKVIINSYEEVKTANHQQSEGKESAMVPLPQQEQATEQVVEEEVSSSGETSHQEVEEENGEKKLLVKTKEEKNVSNLSQEKAEDSSPNEEEQTQVEEVPSFDEKLYESPKPDQEEEVEILHTSNEVQDVDALIKSLNQANQRAVNSEEVELDLSYLGVESHLEESVENHRDLILNAVDKKMKKGGAKKLSPTCRDLVLNKKDLGHLVDGLRLFSEELNREGVPKESQRISTLFRECLNDEASHPNVVPSIFKEVEAKTSLKGLTEEDVTNNGELMLLTYPHLTNESNYEDELFDYHFKGLRESLDGSDNAEHIVKTTLSQISQKEGEYEISFERELLVSTAVRLSCLYTKQGKVDVMQIDDPKNLLILLGWSDVSSVKYMTASSEWTKHLIDHVGESHIRLLEEIPRENQDEYMRTQFSLLSNLDKGKTVKEYLRLKGLFLENAKSSEEKRIIEWAVRSAFLQDFKPFVRWFEKAFFETEVQKGWNPSLANLNVINDLYNVWVATEEKHKRDITFQELIKGRDGNEVEEQANRLFTLPS
jgi:hypothetical protein